MLKMLTKEKEIFIMNCPKCGTEIPEGASFCTGCGFRLEAPASDVSEVNNESETASQQTAGMAGEPVNDHKSADNAEFSILGSESAQSETAVSYETPLKASGSPAETSEIPKDATVSVNTQEPASAEASPYFTAVSDEKQSKQTGTAAKFPVKPLSTWSYIWREFVFLIPIVNIVVLFILAFAEGINKNSRSFARSRLIYALIITVALIIGVILIYVYSDAVSLWLKGALEWLLTLLS